MFVNFIVVSKTPQFFQSNSKRVTIVTTKVRGSNREGLDNRAPQPGRCDEPSYQPKLGDQNAISQNCGTDKRWQVHPVMLRIGSFLLPYTLDINSVSSLFTC